MSSPKESPSVKKLKQAQLPFLLKGSCKKTGKENASKSIPPVKGKRKAKTNEPVVVDLTNCDNSQDSDDAKITSPDKDMNFVTKRRRKAASKESKTDVPSDQETRPPNTRNIDTTSTVSSSSHNVPKIRVTPPTPQHSQYLTDFFNNVLPKNTTNVSKGDRSLEKKAKPAVVEQMDAEREKHSSKEKHKHPPLASILGRKRNRSKSPTKEIMHYRDKTVKYKKTDDPNPSDVQDAAVGNLSDRREQSIGDDIENCAEVDPVRNSVEKKNTKQAEDGPHISHICKDAASGTKEKCDKSDACYSDSSNSPLLSKTNENDKLEHNNNREKQDPESERKLDISASPKKPENLDLDESDVHSESENEDTPIENVYGFDKKLEGKAVVVIDDDLSQQLGIIRLKSTALSKSKGTDLSEEGNPKKRSRRSAEADRKKQEKEKERQEKRKVREEQKLAKEKEKLELQKKKEEEKTRKEEEKRKKRQEEEAAKAERNRLKEEERQKKREEEEAAKADKLRKLEEKKKEKERLELERKLEKERKEEEKRKEKEKREEEKRQRELEKLKAEEEKRRKSEKRAEAFKSFFRSPDKPTTVKKSPEKIGIFVPFQLKQDMFLAPVRRATLSAAKKASLEEAINKQDITSEYLDQVAKSPRFVYGPTVPKSQKMCISLEEDGLELVQDGNPEGEVLHAKFLSFHTNYRPPYYGTWRKRSKVLSYRNPFKKDNDLFDYDFDSDDEWEEPADGEDIDHSDGEDEGEGNEEDEDDGFFVPHGYLSDDEGIGEEGEELGIKPDHKLKQKQLEFEASFKRKLSALTPLVIGCVWKDSVASIDKVHRDILDSYKPEFLCKSPISVTSQNNGAEVEKDSPMDSCKSDSSKSKTKFSVPDEAMLDLVRLLHGNPLSLGRIITEFQMYWRIKNTDPETRFGPYLSEDNTEDSDEKVEKSDNMTTVNEPQLRVANDIDTTPKRMQSEYEISKAKLKSKCKEMATYTRMAYMNRSCWFVHDSILQSYGLDNDTAPVPCRWRYVTEVPKVQVLVYPQPGKNTPTPQTTVTPETPKQSTPSIAKFTSKLSPNAILEESKLKYEKDKMTQQPQARPISKFATEKISPDVIIEKSAQKISEECVQKVKELNAPKISTPNAQEGVYVIPSTEDVKTFFKINDKGRDDPGKSDMNISDSLKNPPIES